MTAPGPPGPPGSPGSLGDEAARLVEAVQDWAARALPADDGCTCTWCPVCRGVAVLRGDRPEVTERLTELVSAAASALTALAGALSGPPAPAAPGPAPAARPEPTASVQRIDLDEDPGP
ncbi:MAG TPA: hypothetical protein VF109_07105 [Mycobacteriales bacterium]